MRLNQTWEIERADSANDVNVEYNPAWTIARFLQPQWAHEAIAKLHKSIS